MKNKYEWDLSKIIKNERKFNESITECEVLLNRACTFKNKILKSSNSLFEFLRLNDEISRKVEKLYVYAYLNYYKDTTNNKAKALTLKVDKMLEDISLKLSFVSPEILNSDYKTIVEYIKENKKLKEYKFSLENTFRYKKHILTKDEEEIISAAANAMGSVHDAYSALNDADVKFGYIKDEKGVKIELTHSNYSKYIKSNKRKVRKEAFIKMHEYYQKHIHTISNLYLGNIKESYFVSNIRKYNSPLEKSLFNDKIDPTLYDNLINSIHDNLKHLYKYYDIKKKMLKLNDIHLYDVYVNQKNMDKKNIKIEEGLNIIYEALKPLGNEYIEDLKKGINNGWIDAVVNKGKRSGAFSWGSYDTMPYLSVNYENNFNSVDTLIHELGHSMHSYYSNKKQNYVDAGYPIFLAEIASTVNQILLNKYMMSNAKTKEEKVKYICEFLENVRTTVFRQTMFAEFEKIVYEKYNEGISLTSEELCNTYYDLNKLYFGKNVVIDDYIKYEWARIPHFYTPFYVYKYATGFMIALVIVNKLLSEEDFNKKYIEFLSSGGSDYPLNILNKLGIELDVHTFNNAFLIFKEYLDML